MTRFKRVTRTKRKRKRKARQSSRKAMMKLKSSLDLDEEEDADDDDNLFAITDSDQDNLFEAFQEISNEDIIKTLRDRDMPEIVTGPLLTKVNQP